MLKLSETDLAKTGYTNGSPEARIMNIGARSLTDAELLSLLVIEKRGENPVELAQTLLKDYGSLMDVCKSDIQTLESVHSGIRSAVILRAAIELGRRLSAHPGIKRCAINSPADAVALVQYDMALLPVEEMRVILLNRRNEVMRIETICTGSVSSAQIRIGEVFKPAVIWQASAVIAFHNHPSGDPTPSPDDVAVTRAMVQAGKMLDVDMLDHIVIGQGRWVSLKERGLGFS